MRLPGANASAIGSLRVLLAASVALPIIVLIALSWLNYRGIIAQARHDLERTSEVARENVGKVFDSQSQLVDYVNDLVGNLSEAGIITAERPLHQVLVRMVFRLPDVMVVAQDGKPLVNADSYRIRRDIDPGSASV